MKNVFLLNTLLITSNIFSHLSFQLNHLDKQDSSTVLSKGLITFLPLHGLDLDTERTKAKMREIYYKLGMVKI